MARALLAQEWFSASELAAMGLPGLPGTKTNIIAQAAREGWQEPGQKGVWWRERKGRGGGVEYHLCVLPTATQAKLTHDLAITSDTKVLDAPDQSACHERWEFYARLPEAKKAVARERLDALRAVRQLVQHGVKKGVAVAQVAALRDVVPASIYNWEKMTHRVPVTDWLPFLAPRNTGQPGARVEFSEGAWDALIGDYLRKSQPALESCYRRVERIAEANNWTMPSMRTVARRVDELPAALVTYLREGQEALARMYPAQRRDRSTLYALEAVNADFHRWDVFVRWPDGSKDRPQMVAFQDIHSGKILAWRITQTPNRCAVRLAFGDLVERYGIPVHCILDNGREFASKWITGGTPTRYRFKVKDDEPSGLLVQMGVEVHWATPYHGQAKPIERAFRDMAQDVAKHPAFEGAYTGNSPTNKPDNYGTRTVELAEFLRVIETEIAAHNARLGRQGGICAGRSFNQVFDESYAHAAIRKASPEQRRLWLLAAEARRVHAVTGEIELMGNRYWCKALQDHLGEMVTVRFDPDHLHQAVHVYRRDGAYLSEVPLFADSGFLNADHAREHTRNRKHYNNSNKEAAEALRKMTARQIAALQPQIDDPQPPENRLITATFGNTVRKVAAPSPAVIEAEEALARSNHRYLHLVPTNDQGDD